MVGHEDKKSDSTEVIVGTSPRGWGIPDDYVPPKLGPLPDHVELGEQMVGTSKRFLVAAPFLLNRSEGRMVTTVRTTESSSSTPSAFRDQLGLDPDPVLAQRARAAFSLDSPASFAVSRRMPPPPIHILFHPVHAGRFDVTVAISIVGPDGASDTAQMRVSGVGKPATPTISNEVQAPNIGRTLEGARVKPAPAYEKSHSFEQAAKTAENSATLLARMQQAGVELAGDQINAYSRRPPPVSALDQLIDLAIMMGVSGVAGVISKHLARGFARALAEPADPTTSATAARSSEHVQAFVGDSMKEGLKGLAKLGLKAASSGGSSTDSSPAGDSTANELSSSWKIDFVNQHKSAMAYLEFGYLQLMNNATEHLRHIDPAEGQPAMEFLGRVLHDASPMAMLVQARATELQWISMTARNALGGQDKRLPDGSSVATTNLDGALDFGERGPLAVHKGTVPAHDGVLDIQVELPVGATPVETSGCKVRGASIIGVSQEIADTLKSMHLRHAGIPIRLIVHGHPALITRDEIGNVRVTGFLRTEAGTKWTEAHMHQGAKALVDKVLAKTLASWGITEIATDDATGRGEVKP